MKLFHIILFCCLFPNWIGLSQADNRWVYSPIYRDKLLQAVAEHESKMDSNARSYKGAVGVMQIMPIMVEEVNRIVGYPCFDTIDRYDNEKSYKMWYIFQRYHNPKYDVKRACLLWYSGHEKWTGYNQRYLKKVMKIYCEL